MTSGYIDESDSYEVKVRIRWNATRDFWLACGHRPAPESGGLYLLCLHGSYCNRHDFSGVFKSESLMPYGVLAVDLPGHGSSSKMELGDPDGAFPVKLEDMAEVILQLISALGLRMSPCVLVGHSLGGAVGVLLSEKLGRHLRALVSLEGCLVATDTPPHGLASRWMRKDARSTLALDLLEDIAAAAHLGRDPDGLAHWKESAEKCGRTVHYLAVRMSASTVNWSTSGKLPDYLQAIPAFHYVYGTTSGKFSPLLASTLHARKNCVIHPVQGCGHFLLMDALEVVLRILADVANCAAADETPEPAQKRSRLAEPSSVC